MEIVIAIVVGVLYAAGVFMLLRRSLIKFIIGIILMSNATNLLVFLAAGIVPGNPPFIAGDLTAREIPDPLPQALVLTAVVIGLGIITYTLALKYKFFDLTGSDDLDELKPKD